MQESMEALRAAAEARVTPAAREAMYACEQMAHPVVKPYMGEESDMMAQLRAEAEARVTDWAGVAKETEGEYVSAQAAPVITTGVAAPTTVRGEVPFSTDAVAAAKARVTPAAQAAMDDIAAGIQRPVLPVVAPYMGPVDEAEVAAARAAAQERMTPAARATIMTYEQAAEAAVRKALRVNGKRVRPKRKPYTIVKATAEGTEPCGVLAALAATSNVIDSIGVNAPTTVLGATPFSDEARAAAKERITAAAQATLTSMEYGIQTPTLPIVQPYMGPVDEAAVAAARAAAKARLTPAALATIITEDQQAAAAGDAGVLAALEATSNVIDSIGVNAPTTVLGTVPFTEDERAAAKERITAAAQKTLDDMEEDVQNPVLPIIQPYMGPVDEAEVAALKAAAKERITPAAAATLVDAE